MVVTDSGISEAKPSSPSINGVRTESSSKTSSTVASSTKNSSSWDEDWGPATKGTTTPSHSSIDKPSQPLPGNPVIQITSSQQHSSPSAVSNQQTTLSCPSTDLEWPPASSTSMPRLGDTESHMKSPGTSSVSAFEDIDPFANWPPRPSGSLGGSGLSNNGTLGPPLDKSGPSLTSNTSNSMNYQNSWAFNSPNSADPVSLNLGNASSTTGSLHGGLNPQNSLGFLKQNQGLAASNTSHTDKPTDLGSIFAFDKNELVAPKLAPPPSTATAVGRGRGRGRGRGPSHNKSRSDKPPLLDLLE